MSWISFASSGGSAQNPNFDIEQAGLSGAATGGGTTVTADAGANTKGVAAAIIASTANAWKGFWLHIGHGSASTRFLIDLSFDGGSTWHIQNLFAFIFTGSGGNWSRLYIPIALAAGTAISARIQSSTGGASLRMMIAGMVSVGSGDPPGFTTADMITTADTANTRAGVAVTAATTVTWTQLIASSAQTYGAFILSVSDNGVALTNNISSFVALGKGANPSEDMIGGFEFSQSNSSLVLSSPALIQASVAASTRLVASVQNSGTNQYQVGLIGLR